MSDGRGIKAFWGFAARVATIHTATYFMFGLLMSMLLGYERLFQLEVIRDYMRPFDSSWVLAGPFLQPVRGLLFALALWPLRRFLLDARRGWLILWGIFIVFGILSTPAAAPCSLEGVIYSKLPLWYHFIGLPEVVLQTLVFSLLMLAWERRMERVATIPVQTPHPTTAALVRAFVIACLAWAGYAVGGLLTLALVSRGEGINIDLGAAARDGNAFAMFTLAFVVNLALVYFAARLWSARRLSLIGVFLVFWAVDTTVPWLYQLVVLDPAPPHIALPFGFFPAVVITVCLRLMVPRDVATS